MTSVSDETTGGEVKGEVRMAGEARIQKVRPGVGQGYG